MDDPGNVIAFLSIVVSAAIAITSLVSKRSSESATTKTRIDHLETDFSTFRQDYERDLADIRQEKKDERSEIRNNFERIFRVLDELTRSVTRLRALEERRSPGLQAEE